MTIEELRCLIHTGEKIDVEFKRAENDLNKDLYQSVCSFNNRDGGHLFLGVADGTKEIKGVNPQRIDKMLKDFTTSINNANKINPPMYLTPEVFDLDGKKIIYIRIPEGTQLRRLNGRIWDRTHEGDIDITDNAELVYKMYARKRNTNKYTKLYSGGTPVFVEDDIFGILIPMENVAGILAGLEISVRENSEENKRRKQVKKTGEENRRRKQAKKTGEEKHLKI